MAAPAVRRGAVISASRRRRPIEPPGWQHRHSAGALGVRAREERLGRGVVDGSRGAVISASPPTPPGPPASIDAGRTRGADNSASRPAAAHTYAAMECMKDRYAGAGAAARGCNVRGDGRPVPSAWEALYSAPRRRHRPKNAQVGRAAPEALITAPHRRRPATPRTRGALLASTGGAPRWRTCARECQVGRRRGKITGQIYTCQWRRFGCRQLVMSWRRDLPPLTAPTTYPADTLPSQSSTPSCFTLRTTSSTSPPDLPYANRRCHGAPYPAPALYTRPRAPVDGALLRLRALRPRPARQAVRPRLTTRAADCDARPTWARLPTARYRRARQR